MGYKPPVFIDGFGEIVTHQDFQDEEIIAVTKSGMIVSINGVTIFKLGAAGTGEDSVESNPIWDYSNVKQSSPRLFEILQELPKEIERRKALRIKQKRSIKRWEQYVSTIGLELIDDDDLLNSLLEEDWDWLFNQYE